METDRTCTSYCGLYCRDCIPSNRRLFALARELEDKLAELHFEEYADHKARGDAMFGGYQGFLRILQAIRGLECQAPCRAGGGKTVCAVRDCVLARQLPGCWECPEYRICELLGPLRRFHPNLEHHLELIRREGMDAWSARRKRHYPWQSESWERNARRQHEWTIIDRQGTRVDASGHCQADRDTVSIGIPPTSDLHRSRLRP